ncbi:MAG: LysM peptidoglycan-binding domain-containing protein [Patulibacter minatonensis]
MSNRPSLRHLMARAGAAVVIAAGAGSAAAPAQAYPVHVVTAGETLSGIAAANGMQVARLAAANGLAWNAVVIAGQNLQVPPADGLYTSTSGSTMGYATSSTAQARTATTGAVVSSGQTVQTQAAVQRTTSSASGSAHYVRPGETLSAIAARLGTSISALAAANGLANPNFVMSGTTLRAPGTTTAPAPTMVNASSSAVTATGPEGQAAYRGSGATATAERLSGDQIGAIAAQHGVSANLTKAVAWQESGWNNGLTSSTGAKGIMQVMPGTWEWINSTLASPPLNRSSAQDNVRAGSLLLRQLLRQTGGDESMALAGYYQGLGSVRTRGMYDDTKQYVKNIQALKARFGG